MTENIILPGEGVYDINQKIKRSERKVLLTSLLNDYLLSIFEYYKQPEKLRQEIQKIKLRCNKVPREEIDFDQAISYPFHNEPEFNFESTLGFLDFYQVLSEPIFPQKQEDPYEIIH